jgi:hypothetical protein
VRTARAECLDWLLVVGRGHLEHVLRIYVKHTTSTVRIVRWGLMRPIDLPGWPSSVGINRATCIDVTYLVVSFMSTTELHERLCAPAGPTGPPIDLDEAAPAGVRL